MNWVLAQDKYLLLEENSALERNFRNLKKHFRVPFFILGVLKF